MADHWNKGESLRDRHERRAARLDGLRSPEEINERARQVWKSTFPDRSHSVLVRLLGIAVAGITGWWIATNRYDAQWWEIGLAALVAGLGAGWVYSRSRMLTNLTAGIIFVTAALWVLKRFVL